jgi:hypothetical protein
LGRSLEGCWGPAPRPTGFVALGHQQASPNLQAEFDPRALIQDAEVIVAVDVMSQEQSLVYGRKLLTEIAAGATPFRDVWTLKNTLDMKSGELAKLLMLVFVAKGVVDYRPRPTAKAS